VDRRFFLLGAPLALGACAAEPVWAPDDLVQRNIYRHPGPNMLTLFTVLNVGSDNGAHSGLMVSGSQRVIFDPAGTFKHPTIPERNDVIFGATPGLVDLYIDYHTRETYYTRGCANGAVGGSELWCSVKGAMLEIDLRDIARLAGV
jgi:hypothetical protein